MGAIRAIRRMPIEEINKIRQWEIFGVRAKANGKTMVRWLAMLVRGERMTSEKAKRFGFVEGPIALT